MARSAQKLTCQGARGRASTNFTLDAVPPTLLWRVSSEIQLDLKFPEMTLRNLFTRGPVSVRLDRRQQSVPKVVPNLESNPLGEGPTVSVLVWHAQMVRPRTGDAVCNFIDKVVQLIRSSG
eukprot:4944494-Pyramimonas_sp.AAC.1